MDANAAMRRHANFNGFRLLVPQEPLVAIDEAHKVLHSIQDDFKLKIDSRLQPFDMFLSRNKRLSKRVNRLFFLAGEAEAGSGGDSSSRSLIPFVQFAFAIEPGSQVNTDGWKGYAGLAKEGYEHHAVSISSSGDPAHVVMPGVHKIASLLKRWMLGTHQGSVTAAHLDAYLDEFAFRFNRRKSRRRGMLFYRLLENAVATQPTRFRPRARQTTSKRNM